MSRHGSQREYWSATLKSIIRHEMGVDLGQLT